MACDKEGELVFCNVNIKQDFEPHPVHDTHMNMTSRPHT